MADAMEMMILSILGPVLRCEWMISSLEEALITTVSVDSLRSRKWFVLIIIYDAPINQQSSLHGVQVG